MNKGLAYPVTPLVEALKVYDATMPERERMFNTIETNEDVYAWQRAEDDAMRKLQEAFYEVTKDRNSLYHCLLVRDVAWFRKIAALGN